MDKPTAAKNVVSLDRIVKDYGAMRALDEVTLEIGGGITGLLGPNGAGKSTLIKVLLGLVKVTSGSGQVLDYQLGSEARSIRAKVGYMPEDDCYIAGMIGVEMVRFQARLAGLPSIEALRRSHEILDFCGMDSERYREVDKYSTGMRQKLKFAQAIVHDPPLLILDEPTSGLDPEERDTMLSRIRVLAERAGKSVIISTHILPDVQTVCDQVVILAKGRVRVAQRLDVLNRPTSSGVEIRCVGSPQPMLDLLNQQRITATLHDDGSVFVTSDQDGIVDELWRLSRESGVVIRSLAPAKNSLEKIFLDAIREGGDANP